MDTKALIRRRARLRNKERRRWKAHARAKDEAEALREIRMGIEAELIKRGVKIYGPRYTKKGVS